MHFEMKETSETSISNSFVVALLLVNHWVNNHLTHPSASYHGRPCFCKTKLLKKSFASDFNDKNALMRFLNTSSLTMTIDYIMYYI